MFLARVAIFRSRYVYASPPAISSIRPCGRVTPFTCTLCPFRHALVVRTTSSSPASRGASSSVAGTAIVSKNFSKSRPRPILSDASFGGLAVTTSPSVSIASEGLTEAAAVVSSPRGKNAPALAAKGRVATPYALTVAISSRGVFIGGTFYTFSLAWPRTESIRREAFGAACRTG